MKKSLTTILLILGFFTTIIAQDHIITLSGIAFSPNDLSINVGETVEWQNVSGIHNINGTLTAYPSNPEGFDNGPSAASPWNWSHTFTAPGTYNYHCDPHLGLGMTGVITVTAAPVAADVVISEIMYNNPSTDDYEFIELYNNGDAPADMTGWSIVQGVDYTFGNFVLNPGEYVLTTINSTAFDAAFGVTSFEWAGGQLSNGGETIELVDAIGNQVDIVAYDDANGWPNSPDGAGPSLVLCDYDADNNDPINWAAATTPTGFDIGGTAILANPNADSQCADGAFVSFVGGIITTNEDGGTVQIGVSISAGDANETQVTMDVIVGSTATVGADFDFTAPTTITFPAGVAVDTQWIDIPIINDALEEGFETAIFELSNPTNDATIVVGGNQFVINIIDDDAPQTDALIISGVYDAHPLAAGPKGVELYALQDIPDLSIFGVGSANNGTGTGGEETTFPAISLNAGDCYFIADDSLDFVNFFGFSADIIGDAANINGDDAIELFENGLVIDVFGDINVDGSGEPWEYLDGWVYRNPGTGPDGSTFILGNWTMSGNGTLFGALTNDEALNPFPVCSYSPDLPTDADAKDDFATTEQNISVAIDVLGNDILPNSIISLAIVDTPTNGAAVANGITNVTYAPDLGFCGSDDSFTYEICDANGCDTATVTVTVNCPTSYPIYDIGTVTTVDGNGVADSLQVSVEVTGIVHGINLRGSNGDLQFFILDNTGGIMVFEFGNAFGYTVLEGDEIMVRGLIDQFRGQIQLSPDEIVLVSSGNALQIPEEVNMLGESSESELVKRTSVTLVDPAEWLGDGSGFNVRISDGFVVDTMRIDNDSEMASEPFPFTGFSVAGLGGQFASETTAPFVDGYQIFPRYWADFEAVNNVVNPDLGTKINFYPNPVGENLIIESSIEIDEIIISNILGQEMMRRDGAVQELNVSDLKSGMYIITFRNGEEIWATEFVKM